MKGSTIGLVALVGLATLVTISESSTMYGETTQPGRSFTWDELTRSTTAAKLRILNSPGPAERANLRKLVETVLQPLRDHLGKPVRISSAYRSQLLNRSIGGADTSQHMSGEAADIKVDGMTAAELAAAIVRIGLPFDQVIGYVPELGGHVHVSHNAHATNRGQQLWSARKKSYTPIVFA